MSNKTPEQLIEHYKSMSFEKALEDALGLRSDDFGHSCQTLLEAESYCLQYFGELFLEKLKAEREKLEVVADALGFYARGEHLIDEYEYEDGVQARKALAKIKEKMEGNENP
jgi:hypothetical protein